MLRLGVAGVWLLVGPAAWAGAVVGPRPALVPSHPVTVDYILTMAEGGTLDVHVGILAGGMRLRVTSPELPTWLLVDRAAGVANVVLPVLRAYSRIDIHRQDPAVTMLQGASFTRRGQARIAGRECTQWQAVAPTGSASGCVTADGVILQGELTSDRRGALARVIATRVQDGAPPPGDFDVPEGFSESPFRLDPKGFGR